MGTGIYRVDKKWQYAAMSVPCGYRDIPPINNAAPPTDLRSLWVQGYTEPVSDVLYSVFAFPVGTGIYRYRCL